MSSLVGKWKMISEGSNGYDAFMDSIGVSTAQKEAARNEGFSLDIQHDGDNWKQSLDIPGIAGPTVLAYTSGQTVHYKSFDGTPMKSVIEVRDDTFFERATVETAGGAKKEWEFVTERDGDLIKMSQTYLQTGEKTVMMFGRAG